jgi:hypothetical protein
MRINKNYKTPAAKHQSKLAKLTLALLSLSAQIEPVNADNYWHCGGDEDGCVKNFCSCIPKLTHDAACCLDFDNDQYPCTKKPKNGCTTEQIETASQHACLSIFFDNNCTNQKIPQYNCSMICNTGGGDCEEIKFH